MSAVSRSGPGHALVCALSVSALLILGLVLGYLSAGPAGSVITFAVVQTLVILPGGVVVVRRCAVAGLRRGLRAWPWTGVPAIAAFALWPMTWGGIALLGWQLVPRGTASAVVDLALWGAAVALGVLWGSARQALQVPAATAYS